jgi:hypothetical protein
MNYALLIIVVGIAIAIWYFYKQKKGSESFKSSFVQEYSDANTQRMNSAQFVQIEEINSGMFLTFNNGRIQLHPLDRMNANQYWLYFPDGTIMSSKDQLCLTWTGYDFPPGPEVCTKTAGQRFYLQEDGRIVNLTSLPYTDHDRPDRIAEQKKRCLSAQNATNDNKIRVPIVTECAKATSRWKIHLIPTATYQLAMSYEYRKLARPYTEQNYFTDRHDGMSGPSRTVYAQATSSPARLKSVKKD